MAGAPARITARVRSGPAGIVAGELDDLRLPLANPLEEVPQLVLGALAGGEGALLVALVGG